MAAWPPNLQEYRKEKARRHLLDFILYTKPDYEVNWHHKVICEYYERWAFGDINHLMLFMPPQNGKTEIVSRRGPAWVLGKNPEAKFVSCSYGDDYAAGINRDVQRIIDSPPYTELFPDTTLYGQNVRTTAHGAYMRNSDLFEIVGHTGRYFCAGRGGGISGNPMTHGNIDDILKGRKEADSLAIRKESWGWYSGEFFARQGENAKQLITATRWNEEDLPGMILKLAEENPNAPKWTVLSFPAIAEDPIASYDPRKSGEPLWPKRYPLEHLNEARALSEYDWAALYQQRPYNAAYAIFNIDKITNLFVNPGDVDLSKCTLYGALDLSKGGNDYAALATIALLPDGRWLVWECDLSVDVQSKSINKLVEAQQQYNYKAVWIEANSLEIAQSAWNKGQRSNFEIVLKQVQRASSIAVPYVPIWHNKPKPDRIRSLEAHFNNGQLCFREDWAKVYRELINQFRIFPDKNAHDDGPDAIEMLIEGITGRSMNISLTVPTKPISRPYTRI
jgi:predicted phage terminase large subunit-like protein